MRYSRIAHQQRDVVNYTQTSVHGGVARLLDRRSAVEIGYVVYVALASPSATRLCSQSHPLPLTPLARFRRRAYASWGMHLLCACV